MQNQTNMNEKKPQWKQGLNFEGARKLMENADIALEKIQEIYQRRREQLINMSKAANKNGRT